MSARLPGREVLHLRPGDAREIPWKNGRGVTRELAIWPHDASFERGTFAWRISASAVDEAGPFSRFPGFERLLVVTRGDGILLAHGDEAPRARLRPLEPYRFDGAWPTTCDLVRGPIADFNVIWNPSEWRADVDASRTGRRRQLETLEPGHAFVHAPAGGLVARVSGEEEPFELDGGDSLWVQTPGRETEVEISGASDDTLVLLVRLAPA